MNHHNDFTIFGLNEWAKHLFEKLGWMVLAHSRRETAVVSEYKKHIQELYNKINQKIEEVNSQNPGPLVLHNDLVKLLRNVEILSIHVKKDFGDQAGGRKQSRRRGSRKNSRRTSKRKSRKGSRNTRSR